MRTALVVGVGIAVLGTAVIVGAGAELMGEPVPELIDSPTQDAPTDSGEENRAPTARIRAPGCVWVAEGFDADGSVSSDPDGDDVAYSWALPRKSAGYTSTNGTLSDPGAAKPTVSFRDRPTDEAWGLERRQIVLRVTDEHGATDTATATVAIQSGIRQRSWLSLAAEDAFRAGEQLSVRVQDPLDCDPVSYNWTISGIEDSPVSVTQATGSSGATLDLVFEERAEDSSWKSVNATISVVARDEAGVVSELEHNVTVENPETVPANRPPVPRIDAPELIDRDRYGHRFTVTAAHSTDPDEDTLQYNWTADFIHPDASRQGEQPVFEFPNDGDLGNHTITLTVTDEHGLRRSVNHTIRVRPDSPEYNDLDVSIVPVGEQLPLEAGQLALIDADEYMNTDRNTSRLRSDWSLDGGVEVEQGNRSQPYDPAINARWDTPGSKTIELTVTDEYGRTATISRAIEVVPADEA